MERVESAAPDQGERVRSLAFLLGTARELLGGGEESLASWEGRLRQMAGSRGDVLRVAVAGTVKSGKSTLVNALAGRDVLKRGAGIITSLVTRVRPGSEWRARIRLKGWQEVNREVTEAALFLGEREGGNRPDLRQAEDRKELAAALAGLGEEALGEGGFFDRNVALLRAYLEGYDRVRELVQEEPRTLEFGEGEFPRHRDFAGEDALAAYVDDLVLEIPGLPFSGEYEIGDCQGYDSPNPRHMEKVQEYLMGAHLVVYVVSSRVGLREADLRFVRDVRALGLAGDTVVVLNADLGEHGSEADLSTLRQRVASELESFLGPTRVFTFSALQVLLEALAGGQGELSRRDALLLELWRESPAAGDHAEFVAFLDEELGEGRRARVARAQEAVARGAAEALRARVEAALAVAGEEVEALESEGEAFREARARMHRTLRSFEAAVAGLVESLRQPLFRKVDAAFHPSGGTLAEEVFGRVRTLEPPEGSYTPADKKRLLRHMAHIYQEMRAEFHRYKVEVFNPRAVDRIRAIWAEVSGELADSARTPADLLVESVEAYRHEARGLGIESPTPELPELAPGIGRRSIPLFSAMVYGPGQHTSDRLLSFAGQWTRKLATGWAYRLAGRKEKRGFLPSLLADGAEAVRDLLAEEARFNLLQYNEQVKHQVLAKGLDELAEAWTAAYRETVETLALDLEQMADRIRREGSEREDLIPQLQGVLDALPPLAA